MEIFNTNFKSFQVDFINNTFQKIYNFRTNFIMRVMANKVRIVVSNLKTTTFLMD